MMGSPEKPIDVEMGDMSEEAKLNPKLSEKEEQIKENGTVKEERFTGLKKEDLLKISSQPKWVRARWALFILFWAVWIAMLVGAILIVVNAPRCKPEPEPQWYQDNVVYEVNAEEYAGGFKGVEDHLPYIESNLHAKTILLTGASKLTDLSAVAEDKDSELEKLVEAAHKTKVRSYVMVDLVVDSLPISSDAFDESASNECANGRNGKNCDLFVWRDGNASVVPDGWRYHPTRQALYRVAEDNSAAIDYRSGKSLDYMLNVIRKWFDRGIDGIKIRDLSKLQNIEQDRFLEAVWSQDIFQNDSSRALYVYSSAPDAEKSPVDLGVNGTNTLPSPVFFTAELPGVVNQNEAGLKMENIIKNWRGQSRQISGYVVSPVGERLAASRFGGLAAGLNLLSMALPGVPILRSGDELAAMSPDFTWTEGSLRDSVPLNGSSEIMKQTKELIVRRVAGIQAIPSLRYDTRDNDTTFNFVDVGQKDVIAFLRKWDKKPTVLVVSNLSPNNHTVNLSVEGGLMKDKKPSEKATVLITSDHAFKETIDLKNVKLNSGTTLILENPK